MSSADLSGLHFISAQNLPFLGRNFDKHTLVFKVMDKMFSFATLRPKNGRFWADMKCNPDKSAVTFRILNHIPVFLLFFLG